MEYCGVARHRSVGTDVPGRTRWGRKGDLSRFIEEAVRARILELSVEQAKASNANVSEADLVAIVAESVRWARGH